MKKALLFIQFMLVICMSSFSQTKKIDKFMAGNWSFTVEKIEYSNRLVFYFHGEIKKEQIIKECRMSFNFSRCNPTLKVYYTMPLNYKTLTDNRMVFRSYEFNNDSLESNYTQLKALFFDLLNNRIKPLEKRIFNPDIIPEVIDDEFEEIEEEENYFRPRIDYYDDYINFVNYVEENQADSIRTKKYSISIQLISANENKMTFNSVCREEETAVEILLKKIRLPNCNSHENLYWERHVRIVNGKFSYENPTQENNTECYQEAALWQSTFDDIMHKINYALINSYSYQGDVPTYKISIQLTQEQ